MDQNSSGLQSNGAAAPYSRQNESQDSLKVTSSFLRVIQGHRVNMQATVPITHTEGLNSQKPSTSMPTARRVRIQEPPASMFLPHRLSTQISSHCTVLPQRFSIQDTFSQGSQSKTQQIPSVAYNRWLSFRESSFSSNRRLDILSSHILGSVHSEIQGLQTDDDGPLSLIQTHKLNRKQIRHSVDVPPSITCSPEASIGSFESFVWDSKDSLGGLSHDSLSSQSTLDSFSTLASHSSERGSRWTQSKHRPLLPMGLMLLLEAKKISRYLSLVLTVAGMLMLNLIAFWQPWIHFQVPLVPSGDPTGPKTIPIDTTFFMGCPDISCMAEYDKNAYLLDLAWACFFISGIMSFCVCAGLIRTIFFPSTNTPSMDFFLFVCSLMTGVSIILGVLFYLMQAGEFLQEGMTYMLGSSFYLAWISVFFFFMTGLFSYLNYMNFWSILPGQARWS